MCTRGYVSPGANLTQGKYSQVHISRGHSRACIMGDTLSVLPLDKGLNFK